MADKRSELKDSLLSFNFLLVTFIGFIFFFDFHSLLLLPLHIKQIGGTESTIGFLMGTAGLSTLFTTPLVGHFGDRIGKKIFVILGLLILSSSTLALTVIQDTGIYYYILRLFHGIAFSLFFISAGALITDIAPSDKRAQAVGLYGVFTIINYALAPYFGKIIIENSGFKTLFITTGTVSLLCIPAALFVREENSIKRVFNEKNLNFRILLTNKSTLIPSITLFAAGAAFIPTLTFIPVFAKTIDIESFDLFFIAYTLSIIIIRVFFGWLPDTYGKSRIAKPSLLLFSASIAMLSISGNIETFIFSALIFGIAHGFVYPSIYSIVIDNVNAKSRTKAFALCSLSFTAGGMSGTFLSGIIAEDFGYLVMYLTISAIAFAAFIIFTTLYRNVKSAALQY